MKVLDIQITYTLAQLAYTFIWAGVFLGAWMGHTVAKDSARDIWWGEHLRAIIIPAGLGGGIVAFVELALYGFLIFVGVL